MPWPSLLEARNGIEMYRTKKTHIAIQTGVFDANESWLYIVSVLDKDGDEYYWDNNMKPVYRHTMAMLHDGVEECQETMRLARKLEYERDNTG